MDIERQNFLKECEEENSKNKKQNKIKIAKIIITFLFYISLFYVCSLVHNSGIFLYGEIMGSIFAFLPLLTLFAYKSIFKASEIIISLFIKI